MPNTKIISSRGPWRNISSGVTLRELPTALETQPYENSEFYREGVGMYDDPDLSCILAHIAFGSLPHS